MEFGGFKSKQKFNSEDQLGKLKRWTGEYLLKKALDVPQETRGKELIGMITGMNCCMRWCGPASG